MAKLHGLASSGVPSFASIALDYRTRVSTDLKVSYVYSARSYV